MLPDRICRLLTAYVDGELNAHQGKLVQHLVQHVGESLPLKWWTPCD